MIVCRCLRQEITMKWSIQADSKPSELEQIPNRCIGERCYDCSDGIPITPLWPPLPSPVLLFRESSFSSAAEDSLLYLHRVLVARSLASTPPPYWVCGPVPALLSFRVERLRVDNCVCVRTRCNIRYWIRLRIPHQKRMWSPLLRKIGTESAKRLLTPDLTRTMTRRRRKQRCGSHTREIFAVHHLILLELNGFATPSIPRVSPSTKRHTPLAKKRMVANNHIILLISCCCCCCCCCVHSPSTYVNR